MLLERWLFEGEMWQNITDSTSDSHYQCISSWMKAKYYGDRGKWIHD